VDGQSHRAFLAIAAVLVVLVCAVAAWKFRTPRVFVARPTPSVVAATTTPAAVVEPVAPLVLATTQPTPEHKSAKPWKISLTVLIGDEFGLPTERTVPNGGILQALVLAERWNEPIGSFNGRIGEEMTIEVPNWPTGIMIGAQADGLCIARAGVPIVPPEPMNGVWSADVRRRLQSESDDADKNPALIAVSAPRLVFDSPLMNGSSDSMMATVLTKEADSEDRRLKLRVTLGSTTLGTLEVLGRPLLGNDGAPDEIASAHILPVSIHLLPSGHEPKFRSFSFRRAKSRLIDRQPAVDVAQGIVRFDRLPPGAYQVGVMTKKGRYGRCDAVVVPPGENVMAVALLRASYWPTLSLVVRKSKVQPNPIERAHIHVTGSAEGLPTFDPGDGRSPSRLYMHDTLRWEIERLDLTPGRLFLPRVPPGELTIEAGDGVTTVSKSIKLSLAEPYETRTISLHPDEVPLTIEIKSDSEQSFVGSLLELFRYDFDGTEVVQEVRVTGPTTETRVVPAHWGIRAKRPPLNTELYQQVGVLVEEDTPSRAQLLVINQVPLVVRVLSKPADKATPISNIRVQLLQAMPPRDSAPEPQQGVTDERGEARFSVLSMGYHTLELEYPDQPGVSIYHRGIDVNGLPKEEGMALGLIYLSPEVRTLEGFVCEDTSERTPIEGASVWIDKYLLKSKPDALTDADGKWSVKYPPGHYVFRIEAPGYMAWEKLLKVYSGITTIGKTEARLENGNASLTLKIVSEDGRPLEGARVDSLYRSRRRATFAVPMNSVSDAAGIIRVENLPAGEWTGFVAAESGGRRLPRSVFQRVLKESEHASIVVEVIRINPFPPSAPWDVGDENE